MLFVWYIQRSAKIMILKLRKDHRKISYEPHAEYESVDDGSLWG